MKEVKYKVILKKLFFMIYNRTIKLGVKDMKKIKNQFAYLLIISLTFYGLPLIDRESEMLIVRVSYICDKKE